MHKLYNLKSIVKFLLVFVVTSYREKCKGFKKDLKNFHSFLKHITSQLNIMSHVTKKCCKIQTRVSRVYGALNEKLFQKFA